eukprot:7056471-Pyramimonas_sp.AAC.1
MDDATFLCALRGNTKIESSIFDIWSIITKRLKIFGHELHPKKTKALLRIEGHAKQHARAKIFQTNSVTLHREEGQPLTSIDATTAEVTTQGLTLGN